MLLDGDGVRRNAAEAIKWLRISAEGGKAKSQYNLGMCYVEGEGVRRDWRSAKRWLRKAARQGHRKAAKELERLNKRRFPTSSFVLPYREWRRLSRRALAASRQGHREVCGVFACDLQGDLWLYFLTNECDEPGMSVLSDDIIAAARKRARGSGRRPLGLFHSHPFSDANPGQDEVTASPLNELNLIYSVRWPDARLWRVAKNGRRKVAVELSLRTDRTASSHPRRSR